MSRVYMTGNKSLIIFELGLFFSFKFLFKFQLEIGLKHILGEVHIWGIRSLDLISTFDLITLSTWPRSGAEIRDGADKSLAF